MGIEAFGIDRASRFATEHPSLRLKFKPRVKSPAPAGLFFTFQAAKQALDSNPASLDPLVGTRQPLADARGKSSEMNGIGMHRIPDAVTIPVEEKIHDRHPRQGRSGAARRHSRRAGRPDALGSDHRPESTAWPRDGVAAHLRPQGEDRDRAQRPDSGPVRIGGVTCPAQARPAPHESERPERRRSVNAEVGR